ncbi:hypothetical protein [Guggenheimella bovis]
MGYNSENKHSSLDTLLGIVLLAVGLFLLSRQVSVYTSFYNWNLGGISVPTGVVAVPFFIGLLGYFINPKAFWSKLVMLLGAIFILVSIILSVRFSFMPASLFEYLLYVTLILAGVGLIIRSVKKSSSY